MSMMASEILAFRFFAQLFRYGSKKISKLCITGLYEGNPLVIGGSPHKGPVTWKMFPFDDIIIEYLSELWHDFRNAKKCLSEILAIILISVGCSAHNQLHPGSYSEDCLSEAEKTFKMFGELSQRQACLKPDGTLEGLMGGWTWFL